MTGMRRSGSVIVGLALTGALLAGTPPLVAQADGGGGSPTDRTAAVATAGDQYGNLWNILPPGSHGNVTALDIAVLLGTHRRRRPRRRTSPTSSRCTTR